jgi:hypothetical protein
MLPRAWPSQSSPDLTFAGHGSHPRLRQRAGSVPWCVRQCRVPVCSHHRPHRCPLSSADRAARLPTVSSPRAPTLHHPTGLSVVGLVWRTSKCAVGRGRAGIQLHYISPQLHSNCITSRLNCIPTALRLASTAFQLHYISPPCIALSVLETKGAADKARFVAPPGQTPAIVEVRPPPMSCFG